jgi:hypothetical protein
MNSPTTSQFTSLCLKLVGVILIFSSLLDYLTLAIPPELLDSQWQFNFTTQLVDRGIVPMVGIAFLLVGYWIDASAGSAVKKSGFELRVPIFILSSFLGLIFLLLVPLHLNNLRQVSSSALTQIEQRADQAESNIKAQYDQLNTLASDPQRLQQLDSQIKEIDSALASGQLQGNPLNSEQIQKLEASKKQLQNFRELAKNPEGLEGRLSELQNQLRDERLEQEKRAKANAIKQGLRTGLSSLLLAIGYIALGWLGLKNMGSTKISSKKVSDR